MRTRRHKLEHSMRANTVTKQEKLLHLEEIINFFMHKRRHVAYADGF